MYREFKLPKRTGGERTISTPDPYLAAHQRYILSVLEPLAASPGPSHGFVEGRSIITNARPHIGRQVVVRMDLDSFFHTITIKRVYRLFVDLGMGHDRSKRFAIACTYHIGGKGRVLPQGACTSPLISNMVCKDLDNDLLSIARSMVYKYTRYADDITFSGNEISKFPSLIGKATSVIKSHGFTVNAKKTSVMLAHCKQSVTGIVVNRKLNVSRSTRRKVRAMMHQSQTDWNKVAGMQSHIEHVRSMNNK